MSEETTTTAVQVAQPQRIVVQDNSEFSVMLDTGRFEQLWRIAGVFADSQLVPGHFQKNKSNCFLGLQMAFRLGVDPMMLLQNTYIVQGRPGMEAKMVIALINSSGLFEDPLDYEIVGTDAKDPNYKVRAVAVRKGTGKKCEGPWIDWAMVKAEGWDSKSGSKWKSIPSQMFCYRAAAFFGRLFCPERLLGMQTAEELQDIAPQQDSVAPVNTRGAEIAARFASTETTEPDEIPMTEEEKARIDPPDPSERLQPIYSLIVALAERNGDTADDTIDALTGSKCTVLADLEDKPESYINDLILTVQTELDK